MFLKPISIALLLAYSAALFQIAASPYDAKDALERFNISVNMKGNWIDELNKFGALSESADLSRLPALTVRVPLFEQSPALKEQVPYISLGTLPTPIERIESIGTLLGVPNLYIKRDDYTGAKDANGTQLYGGNKVRKLEFLLGEAVAHDAVSVMTFGFAGSNHALATSVYADRLNLHPMIMLYPEVNSNAVQQNLLMHTLHQAELHYYKNLDLRKLGALIAWLDHGSKYGNYPYVIPTDGSSPVGAIGFVNAALELKQQIDEDLIPVPDVIYVPCGSCATAAGLLLGCKAAGLTTKIVAVTTEPEEEKDSYKNGITKLFHATNALLHSRDKSFPLFELNESDFVVNQQFCGTEYARYTQEGMLARALLKGSEEIELDGVYTAKTFAALVDDAKNRKITNEVVLFWDTYCGFDFSSQLAEVDNDSLPEWFNEYFEEDVQELDV